MIGNVIVKYRDLNDFVIICPDLSGNLRAPNNPVSLLTIAPEKRYFQKE
jgi:hypothetical protein